MLKNIFMIAAISLIVSLESQAIRREDIMRALESNKSGGLAGAATQVSKVLGVPYDLARDLLRAYRHNQSVEQFIDQVIKTSTIPDSGADSEAAAAAAVPLPTAPRRPPPAAAADVTADGIASAIFGMYPHLDVQSQGVVRDLVENQIGQGNNREDIIAMVVATLAPDNNPRPHHRPAAAAHDPIEEIRRNARMAGLSQTEIDRQIANYLARQEGRRSPHARPRSPQPTPEQAARSAWLRGAFLTHGGPNNTLVGINGLNPLYNHAFPPVPVYHQYHPSLLANGGTIGLAVRIPNESHFMEQLPEAVRTQLLPRAPHPERVECYLVCQARDILLRERNADGKVTPAIYRPHYWAQPDSDRDAGFHGKTFVLSPENVLTELRSVHFTIHSGHGRQIASPDVPEIPFHDALCTGPSASWWSLFIKDDGRIALTWHWNLGGDDDHQLRTSIQDCANMEEIIGALQDNKRRFTPSAQRMIDEMESMLGR